MTEIRFRGTVPFPQAEVFTYFADARNWARFSPGVEEVGHVRGWGMPGGRCRLRLRVLRRRRTIDCEMVEVDPPRMFRYLAREEGQPTAVHDCRFAGVPGGTRVEIRARRDSRRGAAGLYDRLPVRWALAWTLRRSVGRLRSDLARRRRQSGDA